MGKAQKKKEKRKKKRKKKCVTVVAPSLGSILPAITFYHGVVAISRL